MSNTVTIRLNLKLDKKNQNEVEKLLGSLSKGKTVPVKVNTQQLQKGLQGALSSVKQFGDGLYKSFSQFGLAMGGFEAMVKMLSNTAKTFINPADQYEQARIRLVNLYQDQEKANQVFSEFKQIAATTPYALRSVIEAGSQLKAFGLNAENTLKSVADLAAFMGVDVVDAANAVGRAYAGGAGAADVLRERGVLELIKSYKGVEDLSKLTLPEFREAMLSTFSDPVAGIVGSTDRLAESYRGAMSNMGDAIESIMAKIGKKLLPSLTKGIRKVTSFLESLQRKSTALNTNLAETLGLQTKTTAQYSAMSRELLLLAQKKDKNSVEQERYNTLVREMNTQYGKYLPNLITEKTTYFDLAANLKTAADNLEQYFLAKRKEAVTSDIQSEMDKLNKRNELLKYGLELQKAGEIVVFKDDDGFEKSTAKVQKEIEQNDLQLQALEQRYKRAAGAISETDRMIIQLFDDAGDGDDVPAPLDPKVIDKARQSMEAFFLSLKSKRDQLKAEYKDRKSLLEVAYTGDPDGLKAKVDELDAWYRAEQDKLTDDEKKAAEDAAKASIQAKEKEYQAAIALLEAKKQLGLDVTDELAAAQAEYTAWLAVTYGKDSAAYIAALQQKQDATVAFWQKTHKLTTAYMDALLDGFRTAWNSILDASMTGSERMGAIWNSIKQSFVQATGEMVADWMKKQMMKLVMAKTVGTVERAEIAATAAVEKKSLLMTIALKLKGILVSLGQAAAALMKWAVAKLGPAGIVVGGGLVAALMKNWEGIKSRIGFYSGGWTGDGDARAEAGVVHKREIVFESGIAGPNKNALLWLRSMMQRGFSLPELMQPVMPMMAFPTLAGGGSDRAVLDRLDKIERAIANKRFEGDFRLKDDRTATNRYKVHLDDKASYERRVK